MTPPARPPAAATAAAAAFLDAIPQLMCELRNHLHGSDSGLTIAQFRCLKMVSRAADVSLGELAEANGVSAPAMSKLVDGLVEGGLLERRPAPGDRRRRELSVTTAGRKKLDVVGAGLRETLAQRLSALSASDLAAMERGLSTLSTTLVTA